MERADRRPAAPTAERPLAELVDAIRSAVGELPEGHPQGDDQTLVLLRRDRVGLVLVHRACPRLESLHEPPSNPARPVCLCPPAHRRRASRAARARIAHVGPPRGCQAAPEVGDRHPRRRRDDPQDLPEAEKQRVPPGARRGARDRPRRAGAGRHQPRRGREGGPLPGGRSATSTPARGRSSPTRARTSSTPPSWTAATSPAARWRASRRSRTRSAWPAW